MRNRFNLSKSKVPLVTLIISIIVATHMVLLSGCSGDSSKAMNHQEDEGKRQEKLLVRPGEPDNNSQIGLGGNDSQTSNTPVLFKRTYDLPKNPNRIKLNRFELVQGQLITTVTGFAADIDIKPTGELKISPTRIQSLNGDDVTPSWSYQTQFVSACRAFFCEKIAPSHSAKWSDENIAEVVQGSFTTRYSQLGFGLKQDIIVNQRPKELRDEEFNEIPPDQQEKKDTVVLKFKTEGNLKYENEGGKILRLRDPKTNLIPFIWSDLVVYDAAGKILESSLDHDDQHHMLIKYNDQDAVYPVTIDPVAKGSVSLQSDQEGIDEQVLSGIALSGFGSGAAFVGDLNGDGKADIAIGNPHHSNPLQPQRGRIYIYLTNPTTGVPSARPSIAFSPEAPFVKGVKMPDVMTSIGSFIVPLGDVDGDGYDDIAVSAKDLNMTKGSSHQILETLVGAVYIFRGTPLGTGVRTRPTSIYTPKIMGNEDLWLTDEDQKKIGPFNSQSYGAAIATGDFNGDGVPDMIVSGRRVTLMPKKVGATSHGDKRADYTMGLDIFYGRKGKDKKPNQLFHPPVAYPDYTGTTIPTIFQVSPGHFAVGDFDNDGYDDVAITYYQVNDWASYLDGTKSLGQVIDLSAYKVGIIPGSENGLTAEVKASQIELQPGALNNTETRKLRSIYGKFHNLTNVGDINGDNLPDIVVRNAHEPTDWNLNTPINFPVSSLADVNPSPYTKYQSRFTILFSDQNDQGKFTTDNHWYNFPEVKSPTGLFVTGGDFNGDKINDIMILRSFVDTQKYPTSVGKGSYLLRQGILTEYQGQTGGPRRQPSWNSAPNTGTDGIYRISQSYDYNGDGIDDLLVTLPFKNGTQDVSEAVKNYLGTNYHPDYTHFGSVEIWLGEPKICNINGTVYQIGEANPRNSCQVCSASNAFGWSHKADDSPCDDEYACGTDKVCQSGICEGTKNLGRSQIKNCTNNLNQSCIIDVCSSTGSCETKPAVQGTVCGRDPNETCKINTCDGNGTCNIAEEYEKGYCYINSKCYKDGETVAGSGCQYCDAKNSPNLATLKSAGSSCISAKAPCYTGETCDAHGECQGGNEVTCPNFINWALGPEPPESVNSGKYVCIENISGDYQILYRDICDPAYGGCVNSNISLPQVYEKILENDGKTCTPTESMANRTCAITESTSGETHSWGVCVKQVCRPTRFKDCSVLDQNDGCTYGDCDYITGDCKAFKLSDGVTCPNNESGICQKGKCVTNTLAPNFNLKADLDSLPCGKTLNIKPEMIGPQSQTALSYLWTQQPETPNTLENQENETSISVANTGQFQNISSPREITYSLRIENGFGAQTSSVTVVFESCPAIQLTTETSEVACGTSTEISASIVAPTQPTDVQYIWTQISPSSPTFPISQNNSKQTIENTGQLPSDESSVTFEVTAKANIDGKDVLTDPESITINLKSCETPTIGLLSSIDGNPPVIQCNQDISLKVSGDDESQLTYTWSQNQGPTLDAVKNATGSEVTISNTQDLGIKTYTEVTISVTGTTPLDQTTEPATYTIGLEPCDDSSHSSNTENEPKVVFLGGGCSTTPSSPGSFWWLFLSLGGVIIGWRRKKRLKS